MTTGVRPPTPSTAIQEENVEYRSSGRSQVDYLLLFRTVADLPVAQRTMPAPLSSSRSRLLGRWCYEMRV